ncbi:hypothetical protein GS399_20600 [Pedobacter sp. HMF7647]|uniref:Uncharacterized protein n=2 Tax=Hufsiella arboris TaxID=2695275 RepID=A0A7K1YFI6_9SPHI|nr:hypothetical protein [Hufsiella arboris]
MNTVDFHDNINCIRETAPGRYRIILDFATTNILPFLIRSDYNYIWVHNHIAGKGFDWEEFKLPIKDNSMNIKTLARSLTFDFILTTDEFENIMTGWKGGIELIQMNNIPPYYLDLNKVIGNKRYEILEKECDYLFEVDIPSATDYGTLISPSRKYLQSLLDNPEINWSELP